MRRNFYHERVIARLQKHVRETGYNAVRFVTDNRAKDDAYSRAMSLWEDACNALREFDPQADDFISTTYNPKDSICA